MGAVGQSNTPLAKIPITDGNIGALVASGQKLYTGGSFGMIGRSVSNGADVDLGTGIHNSAFPSVNGIIYAAIPDGSGGWYIGGAFTTVGGIIRNRLARINSDGSLHAWNPSLSGGNVNALVMSGTTLYVGGAFTYIGNTNRNRLAAFNTTDTTLTGWHPNISGTVNVILPNGNTIYIGGLFNGTNSINGNASRNRLAEVDAVTGTVTGWDPNLDNEVRALSLSGGKLYVGGLFRNIGPTGSQVVRNRLAAFNTSDGTLDLIWDPNAGSGVNALVVDGGTVYVGGAFNGTNSMNGTVTRNRLAALDATSGAVLGSDLGITQEVKALAVSDNKLFVGGFFYRMMPTGANVTRNGVAIFNTSDGSLADLDVAVLSNNSTTGAFVISISGTRMLVGGSFTMIGKARNYAACINADGSIDAWNPNAGGQVTALLVDGATVYLGGNFTSIRGQLRNRLASVDATSGAVNPFDPNVNGTVYALAKIGTKVYAGGSFTTVGAAATPRNRLAAFNTTDGTLDLEWNPNAGSQVNALSVDASTVYVGGNFTTIDNKTIGRLAAVDAVTGTADANWNPNAQNNVNCLYISNSKLYVGGGFTAIGGVSQNRLAAFNLTDKSLVTSWNPNAGGTVSTLVVGGDMVFLGGFFTTIGGVTHRYVAAVNASDGTLSTWDPNLTASTSVSALAVIGSELYVGGSFTSVGGNTAFSRLVAFPDIPGACANPTSAGTIAVAQSGISPFDPVAFTSSVAASGHTGTLEYKWLKSTTSASAGFSDITSSNADIYDPGSLTQTTWFKRLARVTCQSNWDGAAESNVLQVTVNTSSTWNGSQGTDWNTADNWTPSGVPVSVATVVIPAAAPNVPVFPASVKLAQMTVETGQSLDLGNGTVTLTDNLTNNGNITATTGKLSMVGSAAQTISGTGSIKNLEVDNAAGITISTGAGNSLSITGTLTPKVGALTTNGNLTLKSNASGTARIANHTASASISGDVNVERFIDTDTKQKQWRSLGFPHNGTLALDAIKGFAIDYASGSRSMMYFNEGGDDGANYGSGGTQRNAGYVSFTTSSESIPAGRGVMAWLYGNTGGSAGTGTMAGTLTIRSTGPLNEGGNDVTLPVTYTTGKGWNLVANPFASAIDWNSADIVKTNIDNVIYRWNPASASWTTYSGTAGVPANVDAVIEAGSAFFVKANAASPVLTIKQNAKTASSTGFSHFSRSPLRVSGIPSERAPSTSGKLAGVRVRVQGQGNPLPDEAYLDISHNDATPDFDSRYDAESMGRSSGAGISIRGKDEVHHALLFDPPIATTGLEKRYYPLKLTSPAKGATTLELWTEGSWNPLNSVTLIDKKEGKTLLLKDGKISYPFTMEELKSEDRFILAINHVKADATGKMTGFEIKMMGNPVTSDRIELMVIHPSAKVKHWSVMTMNGQQVGTGSFLQGDESIQHRLTVPDMRLPGQYILRVMMDNGEEKAVKFIRQ
jgi:hypothetical protein